MQDASAAVVVRPILNAAVIARACTCVWMLCFFFAPAPRAGCGDGDWIKHHPRREGGDRPSSPGQAEAYGSGG